MRLLSAIAALIFTAALGAPAGAASSGSFQVIVNLRNPVESVDRKFLADAFLKKVTRWGDDEVIKPVDLSPSSPARQRFSEEVLERSVAAVKSYWQQLIFSGRSLPGPELEGDQAVIAYVESHPGAIGYISSATSARGVKVLTVR